MAEQKRRRPVYAAAPEGKLEVELDGSTLELSSQRIEDGYVDLRSVESAVAGIHLHNEGSSAR